MTPEQVQMVQDSFRKVLPIAETAADIFYERLFATAPQVRPMFPADMSNQKGKLMQTLAVAVQNLHKPDIVIPAISKLGADHVAYGVRDEHYDLVGAALLYTLEKGLGEDWTPPLADAWGETYATVATVMKAAAAGVPASEASAAG